MMPDIKVDKVTLTPLTEVELTQARADMKADGSYRYWDAETHVLAERAYRNRAEQRVCEAQEKIDVYDASGHYVPTVLEENIELKKEIEKLKFELWCIESDAVNGYIKKEQKCILTSSILRKHLEGTK